MTFEEITNHFQVKNRYKDRVQAVCPAHPDKQASLTISRGRTGILLHCHAGCQLDDILVAVGLKKSNLFYEDRTQGSSWKRYVESREKRRIEAIYNYVDCNGVYQYSKIRLDGKKMLYGVLKDNRFQYGLGGKNRRERKALYFNPQAVKQAIEEGKTIFIPEGEKDVDLLRKRGYVALTYGGVNDWQSDFKEVLRGANVAILADNDVPGINVAKRIEADLQNVTKSIKLIIPTPNTPKGDVSDFFSEGHTNEDFEALINGTVRKKRIAAVQLEIEENLVDALIKLDAVNRFPLTDIGSASLFSVIFSNKHRYNVTAKDWFFYDGKHWMLDREGLRARKSAKKLSQALSKYAVNCLPDEDEKQKEHYLKYALTWTYSKTRNSIINDSRDLNFFSNEDLDSDDYMLNLQNSVLVFDGEKVTVKEHDANLLLSKIANVEYKPEAKCERWLQFLDEVMEGDQGKIHYLQKLFGTCLTGDVRLEKMWFLFGSTTRNGKSTMIERISDILGDYSKTIRPETLSIKNNPDSRTASPDVAKLAGTRLCVCSEIPKRMPLDVGLLKTLTGRDVIAARFLHQDEFQFKPKFKLICNTNFLPIVSDSTVFKSDRVQIVSFDKHFTEQERDETLKDKLSTKESLSGILNWMIEGWIDFCREGLEPPEAVTKATVEYETSSDKLQNFINDCLVESVGKNISVKNCYTKYEEWCSENGYHTENKRNFIADCQSKGIFKERGMVDGSQMRNIIKDYSFAEETFMEIEGKTPFD